ncbi:MAG: caspase family protein [Thermodesulfovibrionales bacterium]|nr:caspase family protein [Thermodesulfovibrionales bacterium]MDP3111978.1 caspase family protein [Thermodesulfovibrionales bacterium]
MFRLVYLFLFTFFILISTTGSTFANETRGLRITAKDAASGEQKEVKIYNKSYAVIIGIDQYKNLPMDRQLVYAVRDAKGVAQTLQKNFKFDKIITLYNKDATKDRILEILTEELPKEMTSEDSLFVFWAGHGNQESTRAGDLGYLIPMTARWTRSE